MSCFKSLFLKNCQGAFSLSGGWKVYSQTDRKRTLEWFEDVNYGGGYSGGLGIHQDLQATPTTPSYIP